LLLLLLLLPLLLCVRVFVLCLCAPSIQPRLICKWLDTSRPAAACCVLQVTAPAWPAHPRWLAAFVDVLGYRVVPK
jgi:protease I